MIKIQIVITILTIIIGILTTRKELKALFSCITEREYIEMDELRKIMAKKSNL